MKKITLPLFIVCLFSFVSRAQLMVSKLVGKDDAKYGLGYGVFAHIDIPLASANQSIRVELMDLAFFPTKGENLFTSTADAKAYVSIKLGYKYVFSETQAGFYVLPSAGFCSVVFAKEGEYEATSGNGIAGALEGGYTFEVGQNLNALNFGLKYEYDRGKAPYVIQSVGFRVSYAFGLFRKRQ